MRCEVCGRRIRGKPYKAVIEGAKMVVCWECARLGSVRWEAMPPPPSPVKGAVRPPVRIPARRRQPVLTQTLELVDDFSLRVREARKELGLSHEDLGRKIGERVSVLRKIESGKMPPDHRLAGKLEHALKIRLLVPLSEPTVPPMGRPLPREATLGDMVRLKKREGEASEERGQS